MGAAVNYLYLSGCVQLSKSKSNSLGGATVKDLSGRV